MATEAHMDAVTDFADYLAMQPPTYTTEALAKAVDDPADEGRQELGLPANLRLVKDARRKQTPSKEARSRSWSGARTFTQKPHGLSIWMRRAASTRKTRPRAPRIRTFACVVVYTDIEAAKRAKFSVYYPDNVTTAPTGYKAWPNVVGPVGKCGK